jgi:hypothetical protein
LGVAIISSMLVDWRRGQGGAFMSGGRDFDRLSPRGVSCCWGDESAIACGFGSDVERLDFNDDFKLKFELGCLVPVGKLLSPLGKLKGQKIAHSPCQVFASHAFGRIYCLGNDIWHRWNMR